ncbi:MAG: hypothetical protein DGJ47_000563 [Rickettsiaceae bacterium]
MNQKIIVVCGPTASGKTQFAHQFALKNNGEIVNADSMQIYQQIPIITASPEDNLKKELPYHLYNFRSVEKDFSAIKYINLASSTIKEIISRGKLPIITGGTGMYIDMLINGYNQVPDVDVEVRKKVRRLHAEIGQERFFTALSALDPQVTQIIKSNDVQRSLRAYEVLQSTGKSILYFQNQPKNRPFEGFEFESYFLRPKREFLYKTCNERFCQIFENGAVEEVARLKKQYPNLQTSATKALGIKEISDYLDGKITKKEAVDGASMQTRRYAKRQCTWFNNQLDSPYIIEFENKAEYISKLK